METLNLEELVQDTAKKVPVKMIDLNMKLWMKDQYNFHQLVLAPLIREAVQKAYDAGYDQGIIDECEAT